MTDTLTSVGLNDELDAASDESKIARVYWNDEYDTYEALHSDGYIQPLRDSYDAGKLAAECGLALEESV